MPLGWLVIAVH